MDPGAGEIPVIEPDLLRLIFDGGFGLVALFLLHGIAGKIGALEATLAMVARRVMNGGEHGEG